MENKEELIIIGNKPYYNFPLNNIIDSFERNVRCNLSYPNLNNGTKCDGWALCSHIYNNVIKNPLTEDQLVNYYNGTYNPNKVREFYKNKSDLSEYSFFLEPYSMFDYQQKNWNDVLEQIGCPYRFSRDPRMGYLVLLWALQRNTKIYLSNWSINDEERVTYYVNPGMYESKYHEAKDEILILRWLHENGFVDASLCLLQDTKILSFIEDDLKPTPFIINLLNSKT